MHSGLIHDQTIFCLFGVLNYIIKSLEQPASLPVVCTSIQQSVLLFCISSMIFLKPQIYAGFYQLQLYGLDFLKLPRAWEEIKKDCFVMMFNYKSVIYKLGDSGIKFDQTLIIRDNDSGIMRVQNFRTSLLNYWPQSIPFLLCSF